MKKVFSNLLLTILFPIRLIKKIPKNSFVSGLVFGAILSLVVNVITVQVQETIQKQRILEAVENEILNNLFMSNNVLKFNPEYIKNNKAPNFIYTTKKYSRDLWEQSTEPLQYIAQLDRETQNKISIYYAFTIPQSNALVDKIDYFTRDKLSNCFLKFASLTVTENNDCKTTYATLLIFEQTPAGWVSKGSYELLQFFHPTKDRLNDPFLRLIMGNQSTRPLSGK